ncbi:MAG: NADH-quinone oxidoreductase subunit H [Armatimonadota bacterium]|nr:NADH-quinone oxidoreductase subunit H [Armatimonadota bacterium]
MDSEQLMSLVWTIVKVFVIFVAALQIVPLLIWLERKVVADIQVRIGPNRVGPFGLLQPLADAVKLMMKEDITPAGADKYLYYLAPILSIAPAIMALAVIPWGPLPWMRITDLQHSVLYSFAIASLSVYAVTLAGWASNNKYSLMGALRATSQMISYELGMGLTLIVVVMVTQSLSLREIVEQQHLRGWNILFGVQHVIADAPAHGVALIVPAIGLAITMILAFLIYFTCGIAETNRAPFDLAEAESELIAGFHTEYSSFKFAIFFMAEYVNMVVVSAIATTLFLGGWSGPGVSYTAQEFQQLTTWTWGDPIPGGLGIAFLGLIYFLAKVFFFLYVYMWLRATLPRFRYDQLMRFGWKSLVPIGLANIFFVGIFIAWRSGWF